MKVFKLILNTIPRPILIKMSYWVSPLISLFLKGTTFTDPIDGKSFRKLLPYGYGKQRLNALSPSTLSLERHRLLWLYLQNETDFFTSEQKLNVMHFAPEQEFYKRFKKQKNINYTTTDLLSPLADVKADICNLPFEEKQFDVVFCNHVLEHIEDDKKAMSELYRITKTNGIGLCLVPIMLSLDKSLENKEYLQTEDLRWKYFGQDDHVRMYSKNDFITRLERVGFKVEQYGQEFFGKDVFESLGLDKKSILYVVEK